MTRKQGRRPRWARARWPIDMPLAGRAGTVRVGRSLVPAPHGVNDESEPGAIETTAAMMRRVGGEGIDKWLGRILGGDDRTTARRELEESIRWVLDAAGHAERLKLPVTNERIWMLRGNERPPAIGSRWIDAGGHVRMATVRRATRMPEKDDEHLGRAWLVRFDVELENGRGATAWHAPYEQLLHGAPPPPRELQGILRAADDAAAAIDWLRGEVTPTGTAEPSPGRRRETTREHLQAIGFTADGKQRAVWLYDTMYTAERVEDVEAAAAAAAARESWRREDWRAIEDGRTRAGDAETLVILDGDDGRSFALRVRRLGTDGEITETRLEDLDRAQVDVGPEARRVLDELGVLIARESEYARARSAGAE